MNERIIPVLRINNQAVNQQFMENTLGLKTRLEEAAYTEFSGHADKHIQVVLMESPSMRTRAVRGAKKLSRLVLRIENPAEIESLLARGIPYIALYRGKKGYAFEVDSPEKDRWLLHAEDSLTDLKRSDAPNSFECLDHFDGVSRVQLEQIVLKTPDVAASHQFYKRHLPTQKQVSFEASQGEDLLVESGETWDIDSLRIQLASDADWTVLENTLERPYFKDKKGRFLQTTDPSNIELWFEK